MLVTAFSRLLNKYTDDAPTVSLVYNHVHHNITLLNIGEEGYTTLN